MRSKPGSQNIVQAWGEVLGIPLSRRAELLRTYSFVVGLPDEIAAEVSKVDPRKFNTSLAMEWRRSVDHAFEVDFSGAVPVPHFTDRYDNETLAHLRWCDDLLCRGLPERSAPQQSDLERITAMVTELESALSADPGLDPELNEFLLGHARRWHRLSVMCPYGDRRGLRRPPIRPWATSTSVGRISRREWIRRGPRCSWRSYRRS
jgi:hypothetical protein